MRRFATAVISALAVLPMLILFSVGVVALAFRKQVTA